MCSFYFSGQNYQLDFSKNAICALNFQNISKNSRKSVKMKIIYSNFNVFCSLIGYLFISFRCIPQCEGIATDGFNCKKCGGNYQVSYDLRILFLAAPGLFVQNLW